MSQKCTHKLKVHVQLFLAVLAYTNCHPLQDCDMFLGFFPYFILDASKSSSFSLASISMIFLCFPMLILISSWYASLSLSMMRYCLCSRCNSADASWYISASSVLPTASGRAMVLCGMVLFWNEIICWWRQCFFFDFYSNSVFIKKLLTFWSVLGLDGRLKFWLVYWLDQYVVRVVTYWVLRFKALLQDASWNWQIELYRKKNTFKYLKYHCQWELQNKYYISLQLSTTTAKFWGNFSFLLFKLLLLFDRTRGKKHEVKRVVSSNK